MLLPQTGQRMRVFVPRVLHPVRLRNHGASDPRSRYYWWDRLNLRIIPFRRKALDEWPIAHPIDIVHGGGFEATDLDDITLGTPSVGRLRQQPWPGFLRDGVRVPAEEDYLWRTMTGAQYFLYRVFGVALDVGRWEPDQVSSSSTGPTGPSPAAAFAVVERSGSSTKRSSAMTSALSTHEYTAPHNNPQVAQIMKEKGVGRKRAYVLLRQSRAAEAGDVEVPQTQRVQVLGSLVNHAGSSKNAKDLLDQLHADGVKIDMHDTVKSLWSLQKTRFVSFRERGNPSTLYAIKVTDQGLSAYADMRERLAEQEVDTFLVAQSYRTFQPMVETVSTVEEVDPAALEAFHDQAIADAELDAVEGVHTVKPSQAIVETILPGTPEWAASEVALEEQRRSEYGFDVKEFPLICAIRDRARKEAVLTQAARLLEEAGEDDIALTVMGRTEYTDLELEVKTMLHSIGEV
jgi:hypothetical protein